MKKMCLQKEKTSEKALTQDEDSETKFKSEDNKGDVEISNLDKFKLPEDEDKQ